MPEWLHGAFKHDQDLALSVLVLRLAAALALGCVVAGIYHATTSKPRAESAGLLATLVLLTVLIAMVTLVIGNSIARAFSLVGALAIVRFRTVVEDTRDTAFVMCAVAVGMGAGAGILEVPLLGLPFVALAAWLFRSRETRSSLEISLTVRVGTGNNPTDLLREVLDKHLEGAHLTAIVTARQGAAIDVTYRARLRHAELAVPLVADLNALEGVQSVELRQA